MVIYFPAAIFALCSGSGSSLHCDRDLAASNFFLDALVMEDESAMVWTCLDLRLLKNNFFKLLYLLFWMLNFSYCRQRIMIRLFATNCMPAPLKSLLKLISVLGLRFLFSFHFIANIPVLIPWKSFIWAFVVNLSRVTITMCHTLYN